MKGLRLAYASSFSWDACVRKARVEVVLDRTSISRKKSSSGTWLLYPTQRKIVGRGFGPEIREKPQGHLLRLSKRYDDGLDFRLVFDPNLFNGRRSGCSSVLDNLDRDLLGGCRHEVPVIAL